MARHVVFTEHCSGACCCPCRVVSTGCQPGLCGGGNGVACCRPLHRAGARAAARTMHHGSGGKARLHARRSLPALARPWLRPARTECWWTRGDPCPRLLLAFQKACIADHCAGPTPAATHLPPHHPMTPRARVCPTLLLRTDRAAAGAAALCRQGGCSSGGMHARTSGWRWPACTGPACPRVRHLPGGCRPFRNQHRQAGCHACTNHENHQSCGM
jgi:hypothetical protein